MGAKGTITGEIAVIRHLEQAIRGRWSIETLARRAGVNARTADRVIREFRRDCMRTKVGETVEIVVGMWPLLLKHAAKDQKTLESLSQKAETSASERQEMHNCVMRLAAIAGAARGRIPEAETNGFSDDASDG